MLTLREVITAADEKRDNRISQQQKIKWLSALDSAVYEDIVLKHENPTTQSVPPYTADSAFLIAPERFSEMYEAFLCAKIDEWQNETVQLENDLLLFENAYRRFSAQYHETHSPLPAPHIHTAAVYQRG